MAFTEKMDITRQLRMLGLASSLGKQRCQEIGDEAAAEIERLREVLTSVRAEINLSKAPKLMAKIEAALGISVDQQKMGKK